MRQSIEEVRLSLEKQQLILSLGWTLEHELGCSFHYMSQGYYLVKFPHGTAQEGELIYLPCGAVLKYTEEKSYIWRELQCYGMMQILQK